MVAKKAASKKTAAKKAPAKKAAAKKTAGSSRTTPRKQTGATSAKAWKGKTSMKPHELEVPSGNVCLVQRVGMESLVKGGMIPNSLLGMVSDQLEKASKGKAMTELDEAQMMAQLQDNPEKLQEMFDMVDLITMQVVIEPKLEPVPEDDNDRDDDLLYVDQVDLEDKLFIFDWVVGGVGDVASFRGELAERLARSDARS